MNLYTKVLAIVFVSFFSAGTLQAQQQVVLPPLVNVSGQGEVKVQPDEIILNLGVEVRDRNLEEARKQNDKKVAAILTYLRKNGVDPKHVQTTYMSVQPIYTGDQYGQSTPEFYLAQKTMTVTIKNIGKFDEVLAGVYKAGANRVDGIHYRSTELEKHREQARKLAVNAAKAKAQALSSELGTRIGKVYAITESSSEGHPRPFYGAYNKMMEMAQDVSADGPTISPGQITITANVQVSFTLE
jgi:uncharacterized protein YggE